jgi:hypothetical protein
MVTVDILSCGRDDDALAAIAEALAPAAGDPASTAPMPDMHVTRRRSTDTPAADS